MSCIGACDLRVWSYHVQPELSDILDQFEHQMLELLSFAGALTTPRRESERIRGDGVDSLTLGAAPAGDMPSVG